MWINRSSRQAVLLAAAALVQHAALAAGARIEVVGATGLSQERVQAAVAGVTDPNQAAKQLRQAYLDAGYALVDVRTEPAGETTRLVVTLGRFGEFSGPERLRPQFAGVLGMAEPRSADVITAVTRAEAVAQRSGQHLDVHDAPTKTPGQYTLKVDPQPVAGWHPVGMTLSAGNYGNRYAGRDLGNVALRFNPGAGTQADVNLTKRINHISENNEGADYESGAVNLSRATRYGTYGVQGQATDYETGQNQADTLPRGSKGEIRTAGVYGEQLLYADRKRAWYVNEAVNHASNRLDVNDDFRVFNQDYDYLNLGTAFQTLVPWSEQAKFTSRLWVTQGLRGDFDGIRTPPPPDPPPPFLTIGGGLGEINIDDLIFVGGGGDIIVDLDDDPAAGVDPRTASGGVIRKPKSDFRLLGLNLEYSHPLPRHVEVAASVSGQYTGNTMPNMQQFVLGGFGNLTSWLPGVAAGDRGGLARVGVTRSELPLGALKFTLGSYVEAGVVGVANPVNDAARGWQSVADAGVAITGYTLFGTRATFAYAKPIGSNQVRSSLRDDARADLYFQLEQRM